MPVLNEKYQTLAYFGFDPVDLRTELIAGLAYGVDRIVPIGTTLEFSLNWDGYDLIDILSRTIDAR